MGTVSNETRELQKDIVSSETPGKEEDCPVDNMVSQLSISHFTLGWVEGTHRKMGVLILRETL